MLAVPDKRARFPVWRCESRLEARLAAVNLENLFYAVPVGVRDGLFRAAKMGVANQDLLASLAI